MSNIQKEYIKNILINYGRKKSQKKQNLGGMDVQKAIKMKNELDKC